jgi:hypothetical protein
LCSLGGPQLQPDHSAESANFHAHRVIPLADGLPDLIAEPLTTLAVY